MEIESITVIDSNGKVLLYSVDDFYTRIVVGDDCFICGASRDSKKFNDEHILPDWLLTKYELHNKWISLGNNANFQYGRYTVPCCEECNSNLGKQIETPISQLLKLPYSEICKAISTDQNNLILLYNWLLLIFFKTHLKDKEFNWNMDRRKDNIKISEIYDWQDMHHIHCMIRKDYTNAMVDTATIGSIFILPAIEHSLIEPFDFGDNYAGKTIMIRLDGFCVVSVLNDSCAAYNFLRDELSYISGPLTPQQLREVFALMTYININLKFRPRYYSEFSDNGDYHIKANIPKKLELVDEKDRVVTQGELLFTFCKDMVGQIPDKESILSEIKEGKRRYLFNENGDFLDYSKDV